MSNLTLVIGNKNYSSWSLRPWLAMKYFGLDFAEIRIPLDQENSWQKIREFSSSGKVPCLIHNDLNIWDSLAICEYLAETFPDYNWWGETSLIRATSRCVSAEMHSGFLTLRQQMPLTCRQILPCVEGTSALQKDIDRILEIWQTYRQQFQAQGEFLFGKFTIADAFYAPVVLRFKTYQVSLQGINQQYAQTILSLDCLQEWLKAAEQETEVISLF